MNTIRVIRVGGSLLTWDRLPLQLERFLGDQSPATNLIIAGGGEWVELIRESAERFSLSESDAHWLCIRAMSLTAKLLSIATNIPLVAGFDEVRQLDVGSHVFVLDAEAFLQNDEPQLPGSPLPCTWDVTSDSIAARITRAFQADELVLLKSCDCPNLDGFLALAESGFVDPFFPTAAREVKTVRFVNLRNFAVSSDRNG